MSEARAAENEDSEGLSRIVEEVSGAVLEWLVRHAPVILAVFDTKGICRILTGKALDAARVDPQHGVGRHVTELFPDAPEVLSHFERCLGGESTCLQLRLGARIFDVCCEPFKSESGEVEGIVAVGTDISEQVRATEALAAEEELLKATIEAVEDAVIATDDQARIVLLNRAAEHLLGLAKERAVGKVLGEVVVFEPADGAAESVDTSALALSSIERELSIDAGRSLRLKRADGSTVEVAAYYSPIPTQGEAPSGAVLTLRDLSEERRREEERIRLEKLESLALMASGLSHDFNNMLAAILANLALAKEKSESAAVTEFIEEAETAANQARELTGRLASFARPAPYEPKPVDLSAVLEQATTFALAGKDVELVVSAAPDLWPVLGDENQLIQVFNNLLLNAEQAMPSGGCITVRAENVVVTEGELTAGPYLQGGRFVKVIVEDQGVGIPPENLEKVFDPYFTTKPAGTGLGLSTCFSIVRKHGGHMGISSELGRGTVVLVYLPAAELSSGKAPTLDSRPGEAEPKEAGEGAEVAGGGVGDALDEKSSVVGRALVMDDEPGVRKVAQLALEEARWQVDPVEDAIHAIEKFREALQERKPFDVVVLDSTMKSGLDGAATLAELRKLDPEVKAVAFTGHLDDYTRRALQEKGFEEVVAKPFKLDDLRSAVQRVAGQVQGREG